MIKTKITLVGITGRMGQEIKSIFDSQGVSDLELLGGISSKTSDEEYLSLISGSELIIDFSSTDSSVKLFDTLERNSITGKKVLLCTTGFTDQQLEKIALQTKKTASSVLRAANTSLGILALYKTAATLAGNLFRHGFDIELTETHHRNKVDAPSGTAKLLASGMQESTGLKPTNAHPESAKRANDVIGIHAVRGGGVFGEHEIRFLSEDEEICISHRALSRSLFAKGSLVLARSLMKKAPGFFEYGELSLDDM